MSEPKTPRAAGFSCLCAWSAVATWISFTDQPLKKGATLNELREAIADTAINCDAPSTQQIATRLQGLDDVSDDVAQAAINGLRDEWLRLLSDCAKDQLKRDIEKLKRDIEEVEGRG